MSRTKTLLFIGVAGTVLVVGTYLGIRELKRAVADDAVHNQLRNLSALADEYFTKNGVTSVHVTQLDSTKLYNAGIRDPIEKVQPAWIHKGRALEASSYDGKRTIRFTP